MPDDANVDAEDAEAYAPAAESSDSDDVHGHVADRDASDASVYKIRALTWTFVNLTL